MKEKYKCQKCGYKLRMCICDLSILKKIGDVSAVGFLDKHVSYEKGAGSPFMQGWAYKHAQVKKLNHEKALGEQTIQKQQEFIGKLSKVFREMQNWMQVNNRESDIVECQGGEECDHCHGIAIENEAIKLMNSLLWEEACIKKEINS